MKVLSISDSNCKHSNNIYNKSNNKPNFKGYISSDLINDMFVRVPLSLSKKLKEKSITSDECASLLKKYKKAYKTIKNYMSNLNTFTELDTIDVGEHKQAVVLKNHYSKYVEALDIIQDDKECGTPQKDIEILSDIANRLKNIDAHSIEAKMVLHSDNPFFIQNDIKKRYKDTIL